MANESLSYLWQIVSYMKKYKYDIAISFAEEDRDIATLLDRVFQSGRLKRIKPFYYPKYEKELIGENLDVLLPKIYGWEAEYALIILSKNYLLKKYCQIELEAIKKRRALQEERYVFVIRKDDTPVEAIGLPEGFVYRQWNHEPEQFVELLRKILDERNDVASRKLIAIVSSLVFITAASLWSINMAFSEGNSDTTLTDVTEEKKEESPVIVKKKQLPLFNYTIAASSQPDVALWIVNEEGRTENQLTKTVGELYSKKAKVYTGALNPKVVTQEVFDALMMHNLQSITTYHPEQKLDYLMLGKVHLKAGINKYKTYTSKAILELSVIDLKTSSASTSFKVTSPEAIHTDEDEAKELALEGLINKIAYELKDPF
tara:strand:- start:374 stop:1492 length:1119 start_codon:yes stop_codon:yes gene_type:complete